MNIENTIMDLYAYAKELEPNAGDRLVVRKPQNIFGNICMSLEGNGNMWIGFKSLNISVKSDAVRFRMCLSPNDNAPVTNSDSSVSVVSSANLDEAKATLKDMLEFSDYLSKNNGIFNKSA